MTIEKIAEIRGVLAEIASDAENDAKEFDGKPFNGRTVAEYLGNQGAAIQALARAVDKLYDLELQRILPVMRVGD